MKRRKNFLRKVAEEMELPNHIIYGLPFLCVEGDEKITLDNAGELKICRQDCILVDGNRYCIRIDGKELEVIEMNKSRIELKGKINNISYKKAGGDKN